MIVFENRNMFLRRPVKKFLVSSFMFQVIFSFSIMKPETKNFEAYKPIMLPEPLLYWHVESSSSHIVECGEV